MKKISIILTFSAMLLFITGYAQTNIPSKTAPGKIQTKLDIAKDPSKEVSKPSDKQAVKKVPEKKQKAVQIKPVAKTKESKAKTAAKK